MRRNSPSISYLVVVTFNGGAASLGFVLCGHMMSAMSGKSGGEG